MKKSVRDDLEAILTSHGAEMRMMDADSDSYKKSIDSFTKTYELISSDEKEEYLRKEQKKKLELEEKRLKLEEARIDQEKERQKLEYDKFEFEKSKFEYEKGKAIESKKINKKEIINWALTGVTILTGLVGPIIYGVLAFSDLKLERIENGRSSSTFKDLLRKLK